MQKYVVQLTDDITGEDIGESGESVRFSLDGAAYTIDLSDKNATALREAFQPYVLAARRSGVEPTTRGGSKAAKGPKKDLDAIRTWANSNGYKVSARGRIAGDVVTAYETAH